MAVVVLLSVEKRGLITETEEASRSMPTGQIPATPAGLTVTDDAVTFRAHLPYAPR